MEPPCHHRKPLRRRRRRRLLVLWLLEMVLSFTAAESPAWTFLGASFDQISFDGQALCGVLKRQISCARLNASTSSPDWKPIDNETTYVAVAGELVWAIGQSGKLYVAKWTTATAPPDWIPQTDGLAIHVASNGNALCQDNGDAEFSYATTDVTTDRVRFKPVPENPMLLLDLRMRQDDIYALNASGAILHRKLSNITTSTWVTVDGPLRRIAIDGGKYLCGVTSDLCVVCSVASDTPQWRRLEGISAIDIDISSGLIVVVTPDRKLYKSTIDLTSAPLHNLTAHYETMTTMSAPSSSTSGWTVVGSVMLAILLVAFGVFFVFQARRRITKMMVSKDQAADSVVTTPTATASSRSIEATPIEIQSHTTVNTTIPSELLDRLARDPGIRAVRLDCTDLMLTTKLSAGAFGEVWKGEYLDSVVAVKTLHFSKQNQQNQVLQFAEEIKVMATLQHPRIVHFHGVCWSSSFPLSAIMEFMNDGDVRLLLDNDPERLGWSHDSRSKLGIAKAVTEALVYLHSRQPPIVHRDVKSRNVLLDTTKGAKLGDFGCSRAVVTDTTMTADAGTAYWSAPEVLRGERYSELADVYSLGVLLWELATGAMPYKYLADNDGVQRVPMAIILDVARGNLRLTFNPGTLEFTGYPEAIAHLTMQCLSINPTERPTASDVLSSLKSLA